MTRTTNRTIPYANCIDCGGTVKSQRVQKVCSWGGRVVAIIKDVPVGICTQCGERSYKVTVLKRIESMLPELRKSPKRISVPVGSYAA
jgi:YgiT-type zinc finger domain-containing protein